MRFFENANIDFLGKRKFAYIFSSVFVLLGIVALIVGPKLSVDFTGGVSLELDMSAPSPNMPPLKIDQIREVLSRNGATDVEIQTIRGTDQQVFFLFRSKIGGTDSSEIIKMMKEAFPEYTDKSRLIRLQEEVGPRVGDKLKGDAFLAVLLSAIGMIIYIWWRFEFSYGIAAIIALIHDVLVTIGLFFITGREISLTIIAALLTIVGYSINDTIVIFDRIRENVKTSRKESFPDIINRSINETLSRTAITSLTTLLVVLTLFFFGGSVIRDFAFAFMIGIVFGTYSSIFLAGSFLFQFSKKGKQAKRSK
ncbi:MAG: protein translocase subunit SecF [Candidatus Cloacimonas sp.]|nr:protein translocase subunit SecF [Candidatus Cloacimonadota bacterium]